MASAARILSDFQKPLRPLRCLTADMNLRSRARSEVSADSNAAKIFPSPARILASVLFFFAAASLRTDAMAQQRFCRGASFRLSQLSLLFMVWFLVCRVPSTLPSCGSLPRSALLPVTPVPSDWLRQPLPAWVKSSGPQWKGQTRGLFPLTEASVCSQWKLVTSDAS